MEGFTFLFPAGLFFLWIPVLLLPVFILTDRSYIKSLLMIFPKDSGAIRRRGLVRRRAVVSTLSGIMLLIIGISRPAWGYDEITGRNKGRDIVFVIDVSNSMLAEDLYPNRLERAKLAVSDALEAIDGDRVALVAFGGTAVTKCPLTLDYGFFRTALKELRPSSVSRGGSHIGDALRKVSKEILTGSGGYQDVILITDGEDQESMPLKAAEELGQKEIRLIAIGLGDETTGRRIPVTNENGEKTFMTYKGQEIWTKLDGGTLRKMAAATPGGQYLNVATGTFYFDAIYKSLIQRQESRAFEDSRDTRLIERFQPFIALGLILVFAGRFLLRKEKGA